MAVNMTKNGKKKKSRRVSRRQSERRALLAFMGFMALCVAAFIGLGMARPNSGSDRGDTWFVADGEVEVLAQPMVNTLNQGEMGGMLPFMQATATEEPRPQATRIALPTPVPTADAQPTLQPAATLEPEPTPDYVEVTITAVGDCTLGGDVPSGLNRHFIRYADKYGYDYFFEQVRPLFESDDLTIVNLEGPLTTSNAKRAGRTYNFRGDPEYVNILSGSSVEIANIANNHALDYGEAGFAETVSVLQEAGIGASGFSTVYFTDVKGVRVCSLGFTEWAYSQEQIEKSISLARPNCDLLIVSVHWGRERYYKPTEEQRDLGKAMIDAGADVVIGNHSHVYGSFEMYRGKYIIYSLGNFCFGGNTNPPDKDCVIFQQTFRVSNDGTVSDGGINIIPASVSGEDDTNNFQPVILPESSLRARALLSGIARVSWVDMAQVKWMDSSYQMSSGLVTLEGK